MGNQGKEVYLSIKRIADVIVSILLIALCIPLIILIIILVYIETKRLPIFIQERAVSLQSKRIKILKFRTIKKIIIEDDGASISPRVLSRKNTRLLIGPVGRILRKTGFDELPQLINVIKGEMSIVGPRPLSIEDLKRIEEIYPELAQKRSKLKMKPGITGLWQTNKDDEMTISHLIEMDKFYYSERSLLFDFYMILKTLNIIFLGRHKDALLFNSNQKPDDKPVLRIFTATFIILLIIIITAFTIWF